MREQPMSFPPLNPSSELKVAVSIVIPAYNEEDNIDFVVREVDGVLAKRYPEDYEVIVVDDCSTDRTYDELERLTQEFSRLRIFRNPHNRGVALTFLSGFHESLGNCAIFLPADRQVPAVEIPKFIETAEKGHDIVFGWRKRRLDPLHRLWISALYNLIIRLSFGLKLNDIDSAFLLTRRAMTVILPQVCSNSAFMSVEFVLIGHQNGLSIGEFIMAHRPRVAGEAKGINLKELTKVPVNFLKMLLHIRQFKQKH